MGSAYLPTPFATSSHLMAPRSSVSHWEGRWPIRICMARTMRTSLSSRIPSSCPKPTIWPSSDVKTTGFPYRWSPQSKSITNFRAVRWTPWLSVTMRRWFMTEATSNIPNICSFSEDRAMTTVPGWAARSCMSQTTNIRPPPTSLLKSALPPMTTLSGCWMTTRARMPPVSTTSPWGDSRAARLRKPRLRWRKARYTPHITICLLKIPLKYPILEIGVT